MLAGCGQVPYDAGRPLVNEGLLESLRQSRVEMYPATFHATHRVILTRGDQVAFTSYVLAGRPDQLSLVALSDFGNTIFEVTQQALSAPVVSRNSSGWSDAVLINCAWRDAATVYLAAPEKGATLWLHRDGGVGLVSCRPDGEIVEFQFDRETRQLRHYVRAKDGRMRYQIDFGDYQLLAGWARPVPLDLTVADYEYGYTLNVHLVKLSVTANRGPSPATGS